MGCSRDRKIDQSLFVGDCTAISRSNVLPRAYAVHVPCMAREAREAREVCRGTSRCAVTPGPPWAPWAPWAVLREPWAAGTFADVVEVGTRRGGKVRHMLVRATWW